MMTRPKPGDQLPEDLIDAREAAKIAKSHIAAVYRWVLGDKIRGWKRCGRLFVSQAEVLALFQRVVPLKEQPRLLPTRREREAANRRCAEMLNG